jgi:hypothetical protein
MKITEINNNPEDFLPLQQLIKYFDTSYYKDEPNNIINNRAWFTYLTKNDYIRYNNQPKISVELRLTLKNQILDLLSNKE